VILDLHWLPDSAEKLASSKVFETVVAGGFGAFAGALGAQFAINRVRPGKLSSASSTISMAP
jgi:hypothetical protein